MNSDPQPAPKSNGRENQTNYLLLVLMITASYLLLAYLIMPGVWTHYVRKHPAIDDIPGITQTHAGIPGDPVNVAIVGTHDEIVNIMLAAHWYPADPVTVQSSLRIAADTVFRREYVDAPVSSLYLFHRKEDLAFEQPVGADPKQRHHVRFWLSDKKDPDGRPFWFGATTFDHGVGLSHTTGQITHHISGNVDAERNRLSRDLNQTGQLIEQYSEPSFHEIREGRNGGGDRWWTDGALIVSVVRPFRTSIAPSLPQGGKNPSSDGIESSQNSSNVQLPQ
ncbi:LssY C-terminal domain-containing protein [Planctomicrobium sp. SH668]|uniref:LssY C-terminal domain-containing protein n=1 Tax=Planctomicrobium sp. SH668 TaxID=3448126 RepID=UPI003F5AECA5